MQNPHQKIANNKLERTRSTGSMPRTSGLIPSRTTASKHSTDQHQSLERLFQYCSKRNPKFKKKSLRILFDQN